jgi:spore coat polysaccharide biosynthesis predicted glycosyltransferase SpsG
LVFAVRDDPWAVDRVRSSGLAVVVIPRQLSPSAEVERCVEDARRLACDAAAVDMLDTSAEPDLCAALRDADLRVTTFDDTGPGRLSAHQVINFLVRDPEPAVISGRGIRLREGPKYATLGPEYGGCDQIPKSTRPAASRLLITMGGGDAAGLAVICLSALRPEPPLEVAVVTGAAFPHRDALQAAAQVSAHRVRIEMAVSSLKTEWEAADMAIVAGGLTMHEALVMGVPSIAVCQEVWHQPFLARLFEEQGVMLNLGLGRDVSSEAIGAAVAELAVDAARRSAMSRDGQRLSDGRGTERVVELLLG